MESNREREPSMATPTTKTTDSAVQTTLSMIQDLLSSAQQRNFAVRLWDGTTWKPDPEQETRFTLVLQHPGALRRMFLPPSDLTLGEAYIYNDFDIEGDLVCRLLLEKKKEIVTDPDGQAADQRLVQFDVA